MKFSVLLLFSLLGMLSLSLYCQEQDAGREAYQDFRGQYYQIVIVQEPTCVYKDVQCKEIVNAESLPLWTRWCVFGLGKGVQEMSHKDGETREVCPDRFLIGHHDDNDKLTRAIGWVKKEDVLDSAFPLKTEYYLSRKIIVVNKHGTEPARAYPAPNLEKPPLRECPFFSLGYIYKEAITRINGNDTMFYLLGSTEVLSEREEELKRQLVGWVEAKRCMEWNSRLAIWPNKSNYEHRLVHNQMVKLYASLPELVESLSPNSSIQPIAVEPHTPDEPTPYMMRFPCLRMWYVYGSKDDLLI